MESHERLEPTLGASNSPGAFEPAMAGADEIHQGMSLVRIAGQLVGQTIAHVFYADPLFEGHEVQWSDFLPHFHFPERFELEFESGKRLAFGFEQGDVVGMGTEGFVGSDQALINNDQDGYVTVTDMTLDPAWTRVLGVEITGLEAFWGEYSYKPSWQDTRIDRVAGVRDLVFSFENGSKVYFSLSKSLRGLSLQIAEHERIAIVFDESEARKGVVGPFNSLSKRILW